MSTDKTYNGWSNYETWLVALWLDNERGTYLDRCAAVDDAWGPADPDDSAAERSSDARLVLAGWTKNYVESLVPETLPGFISDLVNSALCNVDWREIADHWLSEQDGYEAVS